MAENPVTHVVRLERKIFSPVSGAEVGKERRLFVKLHRGSAPQWILEEALKRFEFRTKPERGITHQQWLCWVDTIEEQQRQGWTDDERKLVEQHLLSAHDAVHVEPPVAAPPWPDFEKVRPVGKRTPEASFQKIVEIADMIGVSLEQVLDYEVATKNNLKLVGLLSEELQRRAKADMPAPVEDEVVVEA